jgi:hypothetical protein
MSGQVNRKDLIRTYKERVQKRGVFCVRCVATGQQWVGAVPDLDAARNQQWFLLRQGTHRNPDIQTAWNTHGEQVFEFEILETLDKDVEPSRVNDLLKQALQLWADERGAQTLLR